MYPDAVVTCDPRDDLLSQDWIDYPTLIVEVLSPSTERHDRGAKFERYKNIPTFREYVLVGYRQRTVEVWCRDDGGTWTSTTFGPPDEVTLASVHFTLLMDQIYEDNGL